jgi:hypothetical protein
MVRWNADLPFSDGKLAFFREVISDFIPADRNYLDFVCNLTLFSWFMICDRMPGWSLRFPKDSLNRTAAELKQAVSAFLGEVRAA